MDILDRCCQELHRICETMSVHVRALPNIPSFSATAERAIASVNDMTWRPLTKKNLLFHYLPLQGLLSYSALSINVMHPNLFSIFSQRDVTNVLLLSAGGGAAIWIWARPHMQAAAPARRFSWAFLCGSMWSLGSILLWALIRTSIGNRPTLGMLLGLSSGFTLTYTGKDYFEYIDQIITGGIVQDDLSDTSAQSKDEIKDLELCLRSDNSHFLRME